MALVVTGFTPCRLLKNVNIHAVVFRSRFLDYDGAVSTLKPVIDGLKGLVIVDDSWQVTGQWQVDQQKCKRGDERIELTISER